jgi:hypothetical protein
MKRTIFLPAACADEMLQTSTNVMTVTATGLPPATQPTDVFSTTGVTSPLGSLTPVTVQLTFKTPEPPQVTDVVFTVTNGKDISFTFTDENGDPINLVRSFDDYC